MTRLRMSFLALLCGAACNSLFAQLAPQPFVAPPLPHEAPQPGAMRAFAGAFSEASPG